MIGAFVIGRRTVGGKEAAKRAWLAAAAREAGIAKTAVTATEPNEESVIAFYVATGIGLGPEKWCGLCSVCADLPHRRPTNRVCRCGESYAAEALPWPELWLSSWPEGEPESESDTRTTHSRREVDSGN